MIGMSARTGAAIAATLLMVLSVLAIPAPASAASPVLTNKLTTEDGPTNVLGGGNHFFVRFGTDAAFGIVWGSDAVHNNVYFVAIKARYIGVAQVYDRQGQLVSANNTMKIYTLYAVKLDGVLEFEDTNPADGVLQYQRTYDAGQFMGYNSTEPLYKKVSLNTSWDASPIDYQQAGDSKTWEFSLTANDLSYEMLDQSAATNVGDNKLNNITLTFHLQANMVQVDNFSVPQWRITVTRGMGGMMWFTGAERIDDMIYSGKVVTYNVKWDQEIQGWDYDPANRNPMLLMEFGSIIGNYIPPAMATWMEMRLLYSTNAEGAMNCETNYGSTTVNATTGDYARVREVMQNRLTFGADWARVGALTWADNVTVDGEQGTVTAQIVAGRGFRAIGENGALFLGFVVLGGMSFPGGDVIIHDPTFSSEAVLLDTGAGARIFQFILGFMAIIAIVAVIIAVVLGLESKKPGKGAQNSYERTKSSQPGAWAKYYEKK